ncbi:MAG: type II toxin-antitoxin system Phd/YefM family antitoxin [Luteolibacter sp.]
MKTATIREAQHHLSKLMDEVEKGEEIVLTRRGKRVGKLVPMEKPEASGDKKIDWAGWAIEQGEYLKALPMLEGSALDPDREGYRW